MTYKSFIQSFLIAFFFASTSVSAPLSDPGSRGIDWKAVRQKIETWAWAQAIVEDLKRNVNRTQSLHKTPPLGTTGWLHEYYCDEDANRLRFDPQKPHEHVCPQCGHVYSGSPYDDCWRSLVHSSIATAAEQAGALYCITGDTKYFNYVKETLLWYAVHFNEFESHGNHAGKGWIREQSLDEATQLVRLAHAYWDICKDLCGEDRETITTKFLIPDAKFIHQQTNRIHNIHSWHNSAVGLVGFAVGDCELVQQAIDGPHGLKQQIQKGIIEDGFWYEGSIGYHFYTIQSMQPLYLAAKAQNYPLEGTGKFFRMYSAPIQFAFPNGEFPAMNDGWTRINIENMDSYFEAAYAMTHDSQFLSTLAAIYRNKSRDSLNALLYGPSEIPKNQDLPLESVLFKESGIAILRNESVNALLKFSPYGGGHDHYDRLNLILFGNGRFIIPDLGTSGYGIPLNGKWFRAPASHNLLIVDEKRQKRCDGYYIDYSPTHVEAGVKDAFDGVDIRRSITLQSDGILDRVTAQSKDEHQYDLFYHFRGELIKCSLPQKPYDGFEQRQGYDMLKDIKTGTVAQTISLTYQLRDVPGTLTIQTQSKRPFEFFIGVCPDNPANQQMSFLMVRTTDQNVEWNSSIQLSSE